MRLTDIMSHADLSVFPEIALGIFLGVFLSVAVRVLMRDAEADARDASIPLTDGEGSAS